MADDQSGVIDKVKAALAAARRRSRFLDHLMNTLTHYGNVQGNVLAGAVTYFGFLSFFPLMALAFAVVGYVATVFPNAEENLVTAIEQIFPGIVTVDGANNTISMEQIKDAKVAAGVIGLLVLLYSGLGWVSGLRQALQAAFQLPPSQKYKLLKGKAVDLVVLTVLGLVLIISVGISGVVKGFTDDLISWLGLSGSVIGAPLVVAVGVLLGLASSAVLFFVMFRLLGTPDLDLKPLWQGAFVAAAGFEALKLIVVNILGAVGGSPFAPLAIAITLMVWINYFSRLVMYGASWAMTSELSASALALRAARQLAAEQAAAAGEEATTPVGQKPEAAVSSTGTLAGRFDVGSAIAGAAAGVAAFVLFWRQN